MYQQTSFPTMLFLIQILLTSWTQAAATTDAQRLQNIIDTKSHYILEVLSDTGIDRPEKNDRILAAVDPLFDFDIMAKLSLGKTGWQQLTTAQITDYTTLFQKRIKALYLETFHLFRDQTVRIDTAEQISAKRITVPASIIDSSKHQKILYKFYLNKKGTWLIYDIKVEGVSIVQTYRSQFKEILKEDSVTALIEKLREDPPD